MSDERRLYVIGLGANLGDRLATLRSAVSRLKAVGRLRQVSALYETDAVGPPQPDFLNAAVLLDSALAPSALLGALLAIEQEHGRERRERWGPRTLDLDLLYSPEVVLAESDLTLPHPELSRRAFALAPLLDVSPDACEPGSGRRYSDVFGSLRAAGLRRLEASGAWCAGWAE